MPLFEVGPDGLVPLQRLDQAVGDFDRQIEDALWRDPDPVYGSRLLRIQQRPAISGGGRPTLIAVDGDGRLVVIHARQRIDRNELAECLEYFGWARAASLEELASLYWRGEDVFWTDWKRFSDDEGISKLAGNPKLVLVAGEMADRTTATFQLLVENGLPLSVAMLGVWRSSVGTLLLDIGDQGHGFARSSGRTEPDAASSADAAASRPYSAVPFPSGSEGSVPLSSAVDADASRKPAATEPVSPAAKPGPHPPAARVLAPTPPAEPVTPKPTPATPPAPAPVAPSPAAASSPAEPPAPSKSPAPTSAPAEESGRPTLAPVARGGRAARRTGAEPVSPARTPGLTVVGGDGPDRADTPRPVSASAGLSVVGDKSSPARPEPGRPESGRPEPGRPESGRSESGRPESGRPESGRSEPGRPESGRPEPGRPESGRPEPGRHEPGRPEGGRSEPVRAETPRPEPGRRGPADGGLVRRPGAPTSHAANDDVPNQRPTEIRAADPLNDPIATLTGGDADPFPPRPSVGRHGQPPAEPSADPGVRLGQPRRPLPSGSERERSARPGPEKPRRTSFPVGTGPAGPDASGVGPSPTGPGGPSMPPPPGPSRPEPDAPAAQLGARPAPGAPTDDSAVGEPPVIGGPPPTTVLGVPPEFGPPPGSPRDAGPREPGAREPGAREPGAREPGAREPGAR
ncbi:hypothetical protein ACFF2X_41735, partial [Cryptosporangium minutisporangium]